MAVLFYHADFVFARGGFLGVEVFFVISGYLITSLLLVEWLRTGTIGLKSFWLRRARRLLPAATLLVLGVSLASLLIYRDALERMLGDVVAAMAYITNWFLIVRDVSYFESFGRPPLLQHMWSLAVEEQFYILWPLIFTFGFMILKGRDPKRSIRCPLPSSSSELLLRRSSWRSSTRRSKTRPTCSTELTRGRRGSWWEWLSPLFGFRGGCPRRSRVGSASF